jgi:hypothetical protein
MIISCLSACFITRVEANSGGWEIEKPEKAAELTGDVKAVFEQATSGLVGVSYTPMAYYAVQVVSGTNYAVLCYKTTTSSPPASSLVVVKINKDLNGKASLVSIDDFNIGDYAKDNNVDLSKTPAAGAWTVPADYTRATSTPKAASEAFAKATKDLSGNELEIMTYLGSQVVSGTNYAYLCHSKLVTANPVESICMVVVYDDTKGNAKISSINTLIPDTFEKADNSAKAAKTKIKKTFKKKALKKKAKTFKLPKVTTKHGTAKWKVTKKDKKKVLSLSGKKIKVKKGAKKGKYTIKLKATVAETKDYKAASTKVVTVKVTVK